MFKTKKKEKKEKDPLFNTPLIVLTPMVLFSVSANGLLHLCLAKMKQKEY